MSFSALFSFAVLITGCIVIGIILNKHRDLPSRLLAFSLFSLNFTVLLIFLFESKYLLYVPVFFRTGSFFYYLVMPSFYLYTIFVLKSRKHLRWTDTLHLLPAFIYVIDLAPLLFSSAEHKLNIIRSLLAQDNRAVLHYRESWFMPQGTHFLTPIALGFVYIFFTGKMVFKHYRTIDKNKPALSRWLITATSLYFILEVSSLLVFLIAPAHLWLASSACVMTFFFIISLVLFSNPGLLYGHYYDAEFLKEKNGKKIKPFILSNERLLDLKALFETYIATEFYLNSNVDRKEVARYLNIQPHIFSAFVSQAYQANFNDVVNRYRINYVEEGLKTEKWNELTLEAIAEKAGFNNRVTFLSAFKKFTGTTPSQYVKNIQFQKESTEVNRGLRDKLGILEKDEAERIHYHKKPRKTPGSEETK